VVDLNSGVIENRLHWMRDEVLREDRSTIRKGNAPQILAALQNVFIACSGADGTGSVAFKLCQFARKLQRLFALLGA